MSNTINTSQEKNAWDLIASRYNEEFGDTGDFSHEHIIEPTLIDLMGNISNKKIVDIGCGTGAFTRKLAKLGAKVTGTDFSAEMIRIANSQNKENLNIPYIMGDLENNLPFKDEQFDIVTELMVLHSIERLAKAVKETARVLKPGGEAYIVVPNPAHISNFRSLGNIDPDKYLTPQKAVFSWKQLSDSCDAPTNFFIRPFQEYLNLFYENGLITAKLIEPAIRESALENLDTTRTMDVYKKLKEKPNFIIFKLIK